MTLSRRVWLRQATVGAVELAGVLDRPLTRRGLGRGYAPLEPDHAERIATHAQRVDPGPLHALALRAVDAARTAGAQYADARLTRVVQHLYHVGYNPQFLADYEIAGIGVRALVNGYWGFAASPSWTPEEAVRLATDAVSQAKDNAKGPLHPVELAPIPVVTGTWETPIQIDPFTVPMDEKMTYVVYWGECGDRGQMPYPVPSPSSMYFAREERILATSDGSLVTQTLFESGGPIYVSHQFPHQHDPTIVAVHGLTPAAKGWELFLDAKLPDQLPRLYDEAAQLNALQSRPATVGRYTLVCDGATMASLVDHTLGVATQLDRALGYEANAGGTSFLTDPLSMLGTFSVASPLVTVTANRTAPGQLATVVWDDEGVVPAPFTLVKDGIVTDFQTTREQAAWLAPYYQTMGQPVRSHGCAAAEDAFATTIQHQPNLALEPGHTAVRLDDLVADVQDGILVERGKVETVDFQARNGVLSGAMRRIRNGRLGEALVGGSVLFNTQDLWKHVTALGGSVTQGESTFTKYFAHYGNEIDDQSGEKGQPLQMTSHSTQAVAATIANQPVIDAVRKA